MKQRLVGYAWAVLALLALWQVAALALGTPALPGPAAALVALASQLAGGLWRDLAISGARAVSAVLISLALAAPLGLWLGRTPGADTIAGPLIYLTYPVPKVPFLPLLLLALGIGNVSKVALIVLVVFFQVLVAARDASHAIAQGHVLSARSLGAGPAQVYRYVVIPATLPAIFTATRISVGTAIAVLFLAETVAGDDGLGYRIFEAWGTLSYQEMFAAILALALLGVALYELTEVLERWLCAWARVGEEGS